MSRIGLAAAVVLAGCALDLGGTMPWTPAGDVVGALAPEIGGVERRAPALAPGPGPRTLRVVTYNVERGADVAGLAELFATNPELSRADLFLLQEEESHPDEGTSRAERLAEALGLEYAYLPARMKGDATHGLAILSSLPILDLERMDLPFAALTVAEAQRIAVSADIDLGDRRLRIINVHLDTVLNVTDRIVQLRPAVIDAPAQVLVAGDFNTNDWLWTGSAVPLLPSNSVADTRQAPILDEYMRVLGFATPCADIGPTEHMPPVEFRLDAFFVRGLAVGPCHIDRSVNLSDHWPLWIDVTVP